MTKYPHFYEKKPTISENSTLLGLSAGYSKKTRIFIITKKKELEKRSDIDVETTDNFHYYF